MLELGLIESWTPAERWMKANGGSANVALSAPSSSSSLPTSTSSTSLSASAAPPPASKLSTMMTELPEDLSNLPDGKVTLALFLASNQGNARAIRTLSSRCNVNLPDMSGKVPLQIAVSKGHYEAAAALLEAGSDPNKAGILCSACVIGSIDIVRVLFTYYHIKQQQ